jgi:hypothetical protein
VRRLIELSLKKVNLFNEIVSFGFDGLSLCVHLQFTGSQSDEMMLLDRLVDHITQIKY